MTHTWGLWLWLAGVATAGGIAYLIGTWDRHKRFLDGVTEPYSMIREIRSHVGNVTIVEPTSADPSDERPVRRRAAKKGPRNLDP